MVILGVDLRASSKRPSTVVALDGESNVIFFDSFDNDPELHEMVDSCKPDIIAIGAPLGLPGGLCCLETTCSCRFSTPQNKGRQSEIDLARMGISCFFTNKGSIIRNLIYRSIQLNQHLSKMGYRVIEVYPHATKVLLFGDNAPPKNSPGSVTFLKAKLTPLVAGLDPHLDAMDKNTCDAVLNAYTAVLHWQDKTDVLGNEDEGMLVLPKLPS